MTDQVSKATDALSTGGIIGYPTETVFGLGCLPDHRAALEKLVTLKQRPANKGFILLAASIDQLAPYTGLLSRSDWQHIATTQGRATTWIVPAAKGIDPLLTGNRRQVAIRITRHDLVIRLCNACQSPLISTSANITTQPPAREARQLPAFLRRQIDFIIDAPCGNDRQPSRIIELKTGKILRS